VIVRSIDGTPLVVRLYVTTVAALGLAALLVSLRLDPLLQPLGFVTPVSVVTFLLIALGLQLAEHRLAVGTAAGSIAFILYIASALVFGPTWCALLTATTVALAQLVNRKEPIKILFNVSQHVLAMTVGISMYLALGGRVPIGPVDAGVVVPFLGFVVTSFAINGATVSGVVALSEGKRFVEVWLRNTWALAAYDLVASALGLTVAWLYIRFGFGGIAAVVVPILFLRHTLLVNLQLQNTNRELLDLMVKAIEARDPYTSGHSQRVAEIARALASEIGLGYKEIEKITTAALLHDVGKIYEEFAPLLRKQERLTDGERSVMESHPVRSAELVSTISGLRGYVEGCVRHHHENYDGTGYPGGLVGEDIPLGARIVMIADTTDAMTTDRPYRRARSYDKVLRELETCCGRQFDPLMVEAFRQSPVIRSMVANRSGSLPPSMRTRRQRLGLRVAK
jgi:putative nucleotidyltransferase with HDIG domain